MRFNLTYSKHILDTVRYRCLTNNVMQKIIIFVSLGVMKSILISITCVLTFKISNRSVIILDSACNGIKAVTTLLILIIIIIVIIMANGHLNNFLHV